MDVNNRISKKAFAEAYEAATHGTKDKKLQDQPIASAKIARAMKSKSQKPFASIMPINDDEQEGQKKSITSVSEHLASLRQTLEQQSDRIAEFQAQQQHSMMQLQEVMGNLTS